jgi:hypothetical protein
VGIAENAGSKVSGSGSDCPIRTPGSERSTGYIEAIDLDQPKTQSPEKRLRGESVRFLKASGDCILWPGEPTSSSENLSLGTTGM